MPFQALPIAFRKATGQPLAKLLLIYLTWKCGVPKDPYCSGTSEMVELDTNAASRFCECSTAQIYETLEYLESLRLIWPDEIYVAQCSQNFKKPQDRWDFLCVGLPISTTPHNDRKRIKCGDDQYNKFWDMDGYYCVTCGESHDDVTGWAIDHIIPRAVGGADVEENCQAICSRCNSRKSTKTRWVDFLGAK